MICSSRVLRLLLLALILPSPAWTAGSSPALPKDGACPSGYHTEGNYCIGNRDNPPAALPKQGPCPSGYHTEGNYCIGNRSNPPAALPKDGACPSGYHTEGGYCVSNRR